MGKRRVAIYGGGIAGLSAAHELAKHPARFEIDVYEPSDRIGGKARNQYPSYGTPSGKTVALPGEHGFRFFPAFYFHLDRTMAEIPLPGGGTVLDNLVPSTEFAVARNDHDPVIASRRIPWSPHGVAEATSLLSTWFSQNALDLSTADLANMVYTFSKFMMSAESRRAQQFDRLSWYEFTNCDSPLLSDQYRILSTTLPRTMVAMDGRHGSAYTLGKICCQTMFLDPLRAQTSADRVLNGPTDDSWLSPWYQHLVAQGVRFHFGPALRGLELMQTSVGYEVGSAQLSNGTSIEADYHICAVPMDRLSTLIDPELTNASPSLARAQTHLSGSQEWMVGAQYFLRRPCRVAKGHVIYSDSPWALTSISQEQFWSPQGLGWPADAEIRGILSVDISNWNAVAPRLGRPPKHCTREEILDEVFRQLSDALNSNGRERLRWDDVASRHLDTNIHFDAPGRRASSNDTPLFVHTPGTFKHRPPAQTEIGNLLLAADYVATYTNLASMEGANEAARRAVGSILRREGCTGRAPAIRELSEPSVFRPFRHFDAWLMSEHPETPHLFDLREVELSELAAEADRLSHQVSLPRMRAWVRSHPPFARLASHRPSTRRAVVAARRVASALQRGQRLASRRSFVGAARRRSSMLTESPQEAGSAPRRSDPPLAS